MATHTAANTIHRIGPRSAGITMTPEEFDALPEHRWVRGYRYELIRDVLVVSPYPGCSERDQNQHLAYFLLSFQENHPQGSTLDVTLPEQMIYTTNRRRVDRAIWCGLGRIPDVESDAPSIVIEFAPARRRGYRRDFEEKRAEYYGVGVKEYWIIDSLGRAMTVFLSRLDGNRERLVREGETYRTELLPGFTLPLEKLISISDSWSRKKGTVQTCIAATQSSSPPLKGGARGGFGCSQGGLPDPVTPGFDPGRRKRCEDRRSSIGPTAS
jgi:Uma2 family endonuclease